MISSDLAAARVRRVVSFLLPWLFVMALVANVAITIRFHAGTSHALRFSDTSDLADLIRTTYPEMREEYGVYAELRRLGAGSSIALPPNHPFDPDRLAYLAGMTAVDGAWFPSDLADVLDVDATGVMLAGEHLITYEIVAGEQAEPYGAIRTRGLVLVAPIRLLEGAG